MDSKQAKQKFGIIGNSPKLERAIDVSLQVAPTDISILVVGESGTGKESIPKITAEIRNGFSSLLKLIPLFSMAIISVSFAIFEVKNITDMKINKGLNRFPKYGMKLK